jgi:hypothetical protein
MTFFKIETSMISNRRRNRNLQKPSISLLPAKLHSTKIKSMNDSKGLKSTKKPSKRSIPKQNKKQSLDKISVISNKTFDKSEIVQKPKIRIEKLFITKPTKTHVLDQLIQNTNHLILPCLNKSSLILVNKAAYGEKNYPKSNTNR